MMVIIIAWPNTKELMVINYHYPLGRVLPSIGRCCRQSDIEQEIALAKMDEGSAQKKYEDD